jgi:hypothetical protein
MNSCSKGTLIDYAFNKIKKIDYPFYIIFKNEKFANEIFTIYCFHLELSQIPAGSNNIETKQIRSNWWLESLQNIQKPQQKTSHPVISLIAEYFSHNNEIINSFQELVILRNKENELHGFKTNKQLSIYIEKTNFIIWHLIYEMINQCKATKSKYDALIKFSTGIKYVNIASSLYYRDYNNHFFITSELTQKFKNTAAKDKQELIFKLCCSLAKKELIEFIKTRTKDKDLKNFVIYSKLNKSRLHLLKNCYKNNINNIPPDVTIISTYLKITLIRISLWI